MAGGWYVVLYFVAITHMVLLVDFLSPKIDPALTHEESSDEASLPMRVDDEFRPFIRRLPEFRFWYSVTLVTVIGVACTAFQVLNIPVFWPLLLLYVIIAFSCAMKRQVKHMIKYRYLPFTYRKPRYQPQYHTMD